MKTKNKLLLIFFSLPLFFFVPNALCGDFLGIGQAIWELIYKIFVKGPLYIVEGVGDAIKFLSGQKLIDIIFNVNSQSHSFGISKEFLIFIGIAITLILLLGSMHILRIALSSNAKGEVSSMTNRVICILGIILMIPIIFFCINFITTQLISLILDNNLSGRSLANQVGSLGFLSGHPPSGWNYTSIPNWNHYSLFVGIFGSWFCMFVFFLLGLSLVKRLFDIFLLYIISPAVFSTAVGDTKWTKVNLWKDLTISRFLSALGAVIALKVFMDLEPQLINSVSLQNWSWFSKITLQLLFLTGGAIAVVQSQVLFSNLIGGNVGISEGMSMLTTAKIASGGIKAGGAGILGGLKVALGGKRGFSSRNNNSSGGLLNGQNNQGNLKFHQKINPLHSGVPRSAFHTTKAIGKGVAYTAGGVLAGVGLLAGGAHSAARFLKNPRKSTQMALNKTKTGISKSTSFIKNKTKKGSSYVSKKIMNPVKKGFNISSTKTKKKGDK